MKTRLLAFAGSKQAGKSTCSNFLHGYQLRAHEIVKNFAIADDGRLVVNTNTIDETGKEQVVDTYLDTSRKDEQYVEWAIYNLWPFVKKYSFADTLKEIAITMFDLKYEQVYGTDAHKQQQVSHLRWENMPGVTDKKGVMTVREFLQFFGTDVMRKMYDPVWINRTMRDIQAEEPLIAIIDDCRFENEIRAVQEAGGKVIGLTRQPYDDSHSSERVVQDHADLLDGVIDNQNMTIDEMCHGVLQHINDWGWMGELKVTSEAPKRKLHTIKAAD
jgi:hypothetical protein